MPSSERGTISLLDFISVPLHVSRWGRQSGEMMKTCRTLAVKCWYVGTKFTFVFLDQVLIPYHYSSCCCSSCYCWGNLLKKAQGSVVSNWIRMKFGKNVLRLNTDGIRFLIWSHTFKIATKMSLHAERYCECIQTVCMAPAAAYAAASGGCPLKKFCVQFLRNSTFVVV